MMGIGGEFGLRADPEEVGLQQETDFFRLFARDGDDNFSVSELPLDGSAVGV